MSRTKVRHAFRGTTRMTRLNAFDGLYAHPEERGVLHSVNGQKLRDIVDPKTGFVINSVTPTFNRYDTEIRPAAGTSGAGAKLPERDTPTGRWFDPETGLVYRVTADGDAPLPVTRVVKVDASAQDPDAPTTEKIARRVPRAEREREVARPKRDRITDEDIKVYLADRFGFVPPLNTKIRQAARAAIIKDRTVRAYELDIRKSGR